jgi:DNA-binding transcriptional ArsR family regulator
VRERQAGSPFWLDLPDIASIKSYWRLDMKNLELLQFKANFFKALSHPLRIRILELLAEGEKSVNELQNLIGSEGSAVSQQLTVLRSKDIVYGRKDGTKVLYTLRDPAVIELLAVTRRIFNNHLVNTITMLGQFSEE